MTDEEVQKEGKKYFQNNESISMADLFLAGYKLALEENAEVIGILQKLPSHVGRNRMLNDKGECIAYMCDSGIGDVEWLYLHNDGDHKLPWAASYGIQGEYVCLNPNDGPPYNNAVALGDSPLEALRGLYKWCVEFDRRIISS